MTRRLVTLVLTLGLLGSASAAGAREAPHHHRHGPGAGPHHEGARLHHMQRMQRKHDLRRPYQDRRVRRPMRSL